MRDGNVEASKRVMAVMPDRPARILSQACARPMPTGETMPIPVTATRRLGMAFVRGRTGLRSRPRGGLYERDRPARPRGSLLLQVRIDVVDGLLDRGDLLGLLVGDLRFEFLFQRHHQLD